MLLACFLKKNTYLNTCYNEFSNLMILYFSKKYRAIFYQYYKFYLLLETNQLYYAFMKFFRPIFFRFFFKKLFTRLSLKVFKPIFKVNFFLNFNFRFKKKLKYTKYKFFKKLKKVLFQFKRYRNFKKSMFYFIFRRKSRIRFKFLFLKKKNSLHEDIVVDVFDINEFVNEKKDYLNLI